MMGIKLELKQKRAAKRIYGWLSWLSFISVPWFLINTFSLWRPSFGERFVAAGIPATPYLLALVFIYTSNDDHVFVQRHVQQGLLLVVVRFFTAFLAIGIGSRGYEGLPIFFLVNGVIWLFGRSIGIRQVNEGVGMFVNTGERLGNRTIKELVQDQEDMQERAQRADITDDPVSIFVRGEELLSAGRRMEAVEAFTEAYHTGDERLAELATRQLESMGAMASAGISVKRHSQSPTSTRSASESLSEADRLLIESKESEAIEAFKEAFRSGDKVIRAEVVEQLEVLGMVHEF